MAKGLKMSDLDMLDEEQLSKKLDEAKTELFNLRFQLATGAGEDRGQIGQLRRDIARIYTIARERELGIRTTPQAEE